MSTSQAVDTILCPKVTRQFAGLKCATDISLFVVKKLRTKYFVSHIVYCVPFLPLIDKIQI